MSTPADRLPVHLGVLRSCEMAELRIGSGFLVLRGAAFCFFLPFPIYGGVVYLAAPRWVLGVNVFPRGTSPGTRGTLRIGKMAE